MPQSAEKTERPIRRQFQVGTMLSLVGVVALLIGWLMDRHEMDVLIASLRREIERLKGLDLLGYFPQRRCRPLASIGNRQEWPVRRLNSFCYHRHRLPRRAHPNEAGIANRS